jgi:hypothetical protein
MTRYEKPEPPAWPARPAPPGTRWYVGKLLGTVGWYTGPLGIGVFAEVATRRRWKYFLTWAEAFAFAFARASEGNR